MKRCISIVLNILTLCLPLIFGKRRKSTFVRDELKYKIKEDNFMTISELKHLIMELFPDETANVTLEPITEDTLRFTVEGTKSHKFFSCVLTKSKSQTQNDEKSKANTAKEEE